MLKRWTVLCFVLHVVCFVEDASGVPENCEKCVPTDKCTMYGDMTKREQEDWLRDHPCKAPEKEDIGVLFGFAPVAKGDYVCCPYSNIWGVVSPKPRDSSQENGYNQDNLHEEQNSHIHKDDSKEDDVEYAESRLRNPNGRFGNNRRVNNRNRHRNLLKNPYDNVNYNNPNNFNRPNGNFNGGSDFGSNPRPNLGGQCSMSSLPPTPQSGCCGLDVTGDHIAAGGRNNYMNRPMNTNTWNPPPPRRFTRDTPESFGISLDNRIAGGKETDLHQFPWTVLLKTTFEYGGKQSTFNCGGSLISSRYVLTAAHCVNEEGARVYSIDVYLAEYDKRSFPRDCINTPLGRKCIDNILVQAEDVLTHPYYDDPGLQNDIALIRLRENVPYTEFTRPICLPPINIDNPDYSNLRLAVAGWGRNGTVPSSVKQSTVVNLVPQRQCSASYPHLTERHLCAAGRSGEDTCKGDSGGPLMMLYEGKYYVSGVVSGKRADSPCGTAIPSLYTNVFHYVPWIRKNIKQ